MDTFVPQITLTGSSGACEVEVFVAVDWGRFAPDVKELLFPASEDGKADDEADDGRPELEVSTPSSPEDEGPAPEPSVKKRLFIGEDRKSEEWMSPLLCKRWRWDDPNPVELLENKSLVGWATGDDSPPSALRKWALLLCPSLDLIWDDGPETESLDGGMKRGDEGTASCLWDVENVSRTVEWASFEFSLLCSGVEGIGGDEDIVLYIVVSLIRNQLSYAT